MKVIKYNSQPLGTNVSQLRLQMSTVTLLQYIQLTLHVATYTFNTHLLYQYIFLVTDNIFE